MKPDTASTKLRGGYYTPEAISKFLVKWGVRRATDTILEPSCGDGSIVSAAIERAVELGATTPSIKAFEISPEEARKARWRARESGMTGPSPIECRDFFAAASGYLAKNQKFHLVVGNPPFIRYQDFPEDQRLLSFELMRLLGLKPSRLANAWLPFLAISSALVAEDGRLAMVIPAELFQVGYAAEVRQFLASYFARIDIVAFDRLVFPDIQQEVVLLLAERAATVHRGIRVHQIADAGSLQSLPLECLQKQPLKPIDHASEKWTKYFLDEAEIGLLREMRNRSDIPPVRSFLQIDVGVVTGDNDFFLMNEGTARNLRLERHTVPVVGRSAALSGVVFNPGDLEQWARAGKPTRLLFPVRPFGKGVKNYVDEGVRREVHVGYKCRIRKEWFVVPSIWTPDVFFLRQADLAPRIVANKTSATCTDTLHRGRVIKGVDPQTMAVAFMNSLTWAASEVTGRSYGGGVMTYEPSEVERLPLPVSGASDVDIHAVDALVRSKRLEEALDEVDKKTLVRGLGVSKAEVAKLRRIWIKLRDRRRGRKL